VKVAITRAYAARAAPAYRECDTCFRARARARAHTRACTISCCTGLFRRRARIRAETSYVTHNSTNSITKFQVIPVPDLSPHDPSDRETLPYSPDFYPACIALPIAHRVSSSSGLRLHARYALRRRRGKFPFSRHWRNIEGDGGSGDTRIISPGNRLSDRAGNPGYVETCLTRIAMPRRWPKASQGGLPFARELPSATLA